MVVIFTGQSGLDMDKQIKLFINKYSAFNQSNRPFYIKLETELEEIYSKENNINAKINKVALWKRILRSTYVELENYWFKAFESIQKKVLISKHEHVFISIHSCYFHPKTLEFFSLVDLKKLGSLKPDLFITLIDDIYDIHQRLTVEYHDIFYRKTNNHPEYLILLNLFRALDWRSKEIMMTRFFAKELSTTFLVLAIKHSWNTLYKLIFNKPVVAYLSHPITEVRRLESLEKFNEANEIKNEIDKLSETFNESIAVLLPTTIDEFRIKNDGKIYSPVLRERWDNKKYQNPNQMLYSFSGFNDEDELWKNTESLIEDTQLSLLLKTLNSRISAQVTSRDYILVEQSNILVVYRPLFNGNPSGGVVKENNYHNDLDRAMELVGNIQRNSKRKVYIYCPKIDIELFYSRQINKVILSHLRKNTLTNNKKELEFISVNEKEVEDLLQCGIDYSLILDTFQHVLKNHGIVLTDNDGDLTNDSPLKDIDETTEEPIEIIVNEYLKIAGVLPFYQKVATIFETSDNFDIQEFCNRIYLDLK